MPRKTRAKRRAASSESENESETKQPPNRSSSAVPKKELAKQIQALNNFEKIKEEARLKVQDEKPDLSKQRNEKKQIVKGAVPVDEHVPNADLVHVLETDNKIYDCLMNQTNIQGGNNNNKVTQFYVVQVLETDALPKKYYFYNRWGRVGVRGQISHGGPWTQEECMRMFDHKVNEKSVKGDYVVVEREYVKPSHDMQQKTEEDFDSSKLEKHVRDLVRLIFDMKMMNRHMMEIGYDPERLPLGKIGPKAIQQGYKILEEIVTEANRQRPDKGKLEILTGHFYSHIPHDFGFGKAPIIRTIDEVKEKLEMLASLEQIQIAARLVDSGNSDFGNIIDNNYAKLNSDVEHVDIESEEYKLLEKYLHNTHASTHNTYRLEILDIYSVTKQSDEQRFKEQIGNRWLLWHGSRLTNYVGILSQGLRIAPPEAPVTGYMFGKGLYFADMASKSANYCGTSRANPIGCILLCDVALGEWNDKFAADYNASELPPGKHSTRGVGKTAPKEDSYIEFKGMNVPIGQGKPSGVNQTSLLYNEYIVYDVAQVRIKYMIKLQFHYK